MGTQEWFFEIKQILLHQGNFVQQAVAFANADGGTLVIGIEDDFTVTGIDDYHNNVNDILRVPFDYCTPSVRVTTETVECTDKNGNPNHLLVITIPQSPELHSNQQDEVYYRMGDKSPRI